MDTNSLIYRFSRNDEDVNCEIKIRLNDECRNGHEDFSITATFWRVGYARVDGNCEIAGCCHDEILQHFPEFTRFVALHLRDFNGAPMFAAANGFYNLKRCTKEDFCKYFNIVPFEWETLRTAEYERHFAYLLQKLGIPKRWKMQADAAINRLEKLIGTGEKFVSTATKSHFTPWSVEEMADFETLVNEGYYTQEAIKQRKDEKDAARRVERIEKINNEYAAKVEAATLERDVNLVIANNSEKTNFIFYNHTKQVCFNWLDYETKFEPDEIHKLMEMMPGGVTLDTKKR